VTLSPADISAVVVALVALATALAALLRAQAQATTAATQQKQLLTAAAQQSGTAATVARHGDAIAGLNSATTGSPAVAPARLDKAQPDGAMMDQAAAAGAAAGVAASIAVSNPTFGGTK